MKFLFDQNISYRIIQKLPEIYKGSTHIKSEKLINEPDLEIWKFAKKHIFTIVTQDSDFNDLNSLFGFPPKIIWIRMGNISTADIVNLLIEYENEIFEFINNSEFGCLEIMNFKN